MSAIVAGLRASELDAPAKLRKKPVTIEPLGNWWSVRALCGCGCGHVARATVAATVRAAVWRFRVERRDTWAVEAVA
jgi:hypothetical protein